MAAANTSSTSSLNVSQGRDTVLTLVVDAAPLIRGTLRPHLASRFVTIPEVMREVRDRQAREALATLPFELEVRLPSEEAMAAVVAFAKKTGDFATLSTTDLKILALTWLMEKEAKGVEHLRTEPVKPTANAGGAGRKHRKKTRSKAESQGESPKPEATPAPNDGVKEVGAEDGKSQSMEESTLEQEANAAWGSDDEEGQEAVDVVGDDDNGDNRDEERVGDADSRESLEVDVGNGEQEDPSLEPTEAEIEEAQARLASLSIARKEADDNKVSSSASFAGNNEGQGTPKSVAQPEPLDDDGWITPKNVARYKARDMYGSGGKARKEPQVIPVACITSDFAMQNVLLQMGLRLVSVDGVMITRLKSFVLRCHACFKVTKDMEKKFCPHCGNNTLMRTSVGVDADGNVIYYLKKNFQYNNRGTKYSIPDPKGGRKNTDIILREDQREYQKAMTQQKRQKASADPFDLDHILLDGSAKSRMHHSGPTIGFGRRNVNESRKPRRR
ncbi:Nin1 binding protein [Borealophlyctis nickersoniae]|nr:Nin1 binding protein [Borealophlyctis nickersoniae]